MQKWETILVGIHKFENNPQISVNFAHIHLLPALCRSKIIPLAFFFFFYQNRCSLRTLKEGINIMFRTNKNIPQGNESIKNVFLLPIFFYLMTNKQTQR